MVNIKSVQTAVAVPVILMMCILSSSAKADEYVWQGYSWVSPYYGTTLTVNNWNDIVSCAGYLGGDGSFHNGWGNTWFDNSTACSHFPGTDDNVTIPAGNSLSIEGSGCDEVCGNLTIGSGAALDLKIARLEIYGPVLTNDGTITARNYAGNRGGINLCGDLAVTGSSAVAFNDGVIVSKNVIRQLTIDAGQMLTGITYIGNNTTTELPITVVNNGTVISSPLAYALCIYGSDSCVNNGLIAAAATSGSYSGYVYLYGIWDNANGVIHAEDGGTVELMCYDMDGDSVKEGELCGGVVTTEGSGKLLSDESNFVVRDITLDGKWVCSAYRANSLAGIINNNGSIIIGRTSGSGGEGIMTLVEEVQLMGDGVTLIGYGGSIVPDISSVEDEVLTIANGHVLKIGDNGKLGISSNAIEVVNDGVIEFDSSTVEVNTLAHIYTTANGLTNNGKILIRIGETETNAERLDFNGTLNQTDSGQLTVDGWLRMANNLTVAGGVVDGSGVIETRGYILTLGGSSNGMTLDLGRDAVTIRASSGSVVFEDGVNVIWRPGNGVTNSFNAAGIVLDGGTVYVKVIPQGIVSLDGDYVLMAGSGISGSAVWDIELPDGWSCDGVAVEGNNIVIKNINGEKTNYDSLDLAGLAECWLSTSDDVRYDENYDLVYDYVIDLNDFGYLARYWLP